MTDAPASSVAESESGRDGGGGGGGWATGQRSSLLTNPPASPAAWRTAAALIARATATPRAGEGGDLNTLLAAVGEDGAEAGAGPTAEPPKPPAGGGVSPPPPPQQQQRHRSPEPWWLTRLADAGGGAGRNAVQVAVGVAVAALPSVLGPGWSAAFPGACTAPTYTLIALLMMSPSSTVGVRFINAASLVGPAFLGSLAGGGAVSLASAADSSAGWGFVAALAAAAVPILAAAAVVRGAPHAPPHVAGMGLVIALAAGSNMLGGASALAAAHNVAATAAAAAGGPRPAPPRSALHEHWLSTVTPTLAAFGVAGVATVVASLLFPSLASVDVEAVTSRALDGCGEALSHTSARLFAVAADPGLLARSASTGKPLPPAGAGAAALPPVALESTGEAKAPLLLMEQEPVDAPEFEAWWARLCAPVDAGDGPGSGGGAGSAPGARTGLTGRLASGLESVVSRRRRTPGGKGAPPPADGVLNGGNRSSGDRRPSGDGNGHGAASHRSLADPGPPVSSLRPLLAAARAALAASAAEPPLLRGFRARPFCPAAWDRLLAGLDALVTALSALQAVAGDDTALSETRRLYPPRLEVALQGALASAAACLALTAARVEGEVEEEIGGAESSCPAPGDREDWPALLDGLRAAMAASVDGYVSRAQAAAPGSPVVLPSAYTARSHAFAYVAAASVVARVAEVDAAADVALGCGACASVTSKTSTTPPATPRAFAWLVSLARIALCVPAWVAMARAARSVGRRVGRALLGKRHRRHQGRGPGPRPWRARVAVIKYFLTVWVALAASLAATSGSPALARLGPVAGFTAAALTASDKVEATLTKTLLWSGATVLGGLVGGGLASIPRLSPPALAGVITGFAGVVGAGARTGFRTSATLSLLTLTSIALCNASGTAGAAVCASLGKAASPWCGLAGGPGARPVPVWTAVAGRTVSVLVGLLLAQAVCVFLMPWYVTDWALASISAALRDGAEPFMERQSWRFIANGRDAWVAAAAARGQQVAAVDAGAASGEEEEDEEAPPPVLRPVYGLAASMPAPLPPAGLDPLSPLLDPRGRPVGGAWTDDSGASALQVALASPLVDVQANLARDATAWSRGVLATPRSVRVVLRSALSLLDALAALSFALDPAIVEGGKGSSASLTGVLYEAYTVRTFPEVLAVFRALRVLAEAVAVHAVAAHPHRAGWLECCGGHATATATATPTPTPTPTPTTPRRRRAACTRATLETALADLIAARKTSIAAQAAARRDYHAAMVAAAAAEGGDGARADTFKAPVDVVRHLAFMGALIKASNRFQSVAVAVLQV